MNELATRTNQEVNNNLTMRTARTISQVSISSASSLHSDTSDENLSKLERKASLQEIIEAAEDKKLQAQYNKKCRSMSDGEAAKLNDEDPSFEVFPSLPNSVLEKLGLHGDGPRERLSEEELEQKFTSLALAFAIDGATIKDRCERQRRNRDRTEMNLSIEIERLKEQLALMQPLCTDIEKAELLSTVLTQIDIVMNATSLVSISAERYGSVQHEDRLTESVNLMVNHVQMLKQQRDSARRQLQYTKKVLQNSGDSAVISPTGPQKSLPLTANRKVIGRRRASIGTFSQQLMDANKPLIDRKVTRRTSDLSLRASSHTRNLRPNRLELGGELVKITEDFVAPPVYYDAPQEQESDTENSYADTRASLSSPEEEVPPRIVDISKLSFREKINYNLGNLIQTVGEKYRVWCENGTMHEIYCFGALMCFSISLLTMVNILIEYEYSKRGLGSPAIFWTWTRPLDNDNHGT